MPAVLDAVQFGQSAITIDPGRWMQSNNEDEDMIVFEGGTVHPTRLFLVRNQ
jgi:hypothetical protein